MPDAPDQGPVRQSRLDVWVPAGIGAIGLIALLVLVTVNPYPSPIQVRVYLVVLALSAAAFAVVIPGLLNIDVTIPGLALRAAGAIAVFCLVFFYEPANKSILEAFGVQTPGKITKFIPWNTDLATVPAPYLTCSGPKFPANSIAQVSLAGDWTVGNTTGVGPCDRKSPTFVVVRDANTHEEKKRELYEHPNLVKTDVDYEVCIQLPVPSKIQDTLRFTISEGSKDAYDNRFKSAACPIP